jgi:ABC-type lipoprotein export system ATPase subunit
MRDESKELSKTTGKSTWFTILSRVIEKTTNHVLVEREERRSDLEDDGRREVEGQNSEVKLVFLETELKLSECLLKNENAKLELEIERLKQLLIIKEHELQFQKDLVQLFKDDLYRSMPSELHVDEKRVVSDNNGVNTPGKK